MSEDEFNALTAKMRANHAAKHAVHAVLVNGLGSGNATGAIQSALGGLGGVPSGLGAGNVCTPPTTLPGAANGQSTSGLLPAFSPAQVPLGGSILSQWVTPADIQIASLLSQQAPAYGEQGPDTDGLAKYLVSDGHEHPQVAMQRLLAAGSDTAEFQARIARKEAARKEAANEALVAKLNATMADMRALQRQSEQWRAEAQRLGELAQDLQAQLNARHGAAGEPQTMVSNICQSETPRVNPFAHGWATNWKMR